MTTNLSGSVALRVRAPYFADLTRTLEELPQGETRETLILQPMISPKEISDSLPAAYHFAELPFEEGTPLGRARFQRDCIT